MFPGSNLGEGCTHRARGGAWGRLANQGQAAAGSGGDAGWALAWHMPPLLLASSCCTHNEMSTQKPQARPEAGTRLACTSDWGVAPPTRGARATGEHCCPSTNCSGSHTAVTNTPDWLTTPHKLQGWGWLNQNCHLAGCSRAEQGPGRARGGRWRRVQAGPPRLSVSRLSTLIDRLFRLRKTPGHRRWMRSRRIRSMHMHRPHARAGRPPAATSLLSRVRGSSQS